MGTFWGHRANMKQVAVRISRVRWLVRISPPLEGRGWGGVFDWLIISYFAQSDGAHPPTLPDSVDNAHPNAKARPKSPRSRYVLLMEELKKAAFIFVYGKTFVILPEISNNMTQLSQVGMSKENNRV